MLVTLIPLFDENLTVSAYSLFTQKHNYLLHPNYLGTGQNDGASRIEGLEVMEAMGIETLSPTHQVFVSVGNISIFSDIPGQCSVPHDRLILLIDNSIPPIEMYLNRLKELKSMGYHLAIRNLPVSSYEAYAPVFALMDYILIDSRKVDIPRVKIYFQKLYPHIKLAASNIKTMEDFKKLKEDNSCTLFEGKFFRLPIAQGSTTEVAPLKINYIELMNLVNADDFDLTKAADIIGRDTALTILLLQMVNKMAVNSEITSIRHAAAMLGQKELKRWINTAVVNELCSDKPSEITRLSLLRAKFAENLASSFELAGKSSELFLMGLFSVLDLILDKPMDEALKLVKVSHEIEDALLSQKGALADVMEFITQYEAANWQEVSRLIVLKNLDMDRIYDAYMKSLKWYRELVSIQA